jgi:L-lactate dehydrogenase complex protein LldG
LAKNPVLSQALSCLRCGGCLYECPVFGLTAGHFGDKYFAANGATWAATISMKPEKAAAVAYSCLTCGRCKQRCPMAIDGPAMAIEVRRMTSQSKT